MNGLNSYCIEESFSSFGIIFFLPIRILLRNHFCRSNFSSSANAISNGDLKLKAEVKNVNEYCFSFQIKNSQTEVGYCGGFKI